MKTSPTAYIITKDLSKTKYNYERICYNLVYERKKK